MENNIKEVEFLKELIKKCDDRIAILTKQDSVEQDEDLTMDEDVVEEQPVAQKPPVDPNLNNPIVIPEAQPVETPAEKQEEGPTEKPAGLTNFKESLAEYPSEIDLVNPAQVKIEEKPKTTMFKKPQFDSFNNIEIDIVKPNAQAPVASAPAQPVAPAVEQAAQFGQAPAAPAPGITPGQFTDGSNPGQALAS